MDTNRAGGEGAGEGLVDAERRAELLKRGWALLVERNYPAIQELLEPLPEEELVREPELGFLLATTWYRLEEIQQALHLVRLIEEPCARHSNPRLDRERNNLQGVLLLSVGSVAEAEACFTEVLESAREVGDEVYQSYAYSNLGVIADMRCWHAKALTLFQRALAAYQQQGNGLGIGTVHQNVGMMYRTLGLLRESDSHFEAAHRLFVAFGSENEISAAEAERALVLCKMGDLRLAKILAGRAYETNVLQGMERDRGETLRVLGIIAWYSGDSASAQANLIESLEISRATSNPLLEAEVLEELAVLAQARGEESEMQRLLDECAAIYERIGTPARAQRARERLLPTRVGEAYA